MDIINLNSNSVSIQSDEYGMRAYVNSIRGRAQLEAECTADIVKAVESVWGDKPTVIEPTFPTQAKTIPEQDEMNAAMMMRISTLEMAVKK